VTQEREPLKVNLIHHIDHMVDAGGAWDGDRIGLGIVENAAETINGNAEVHGAAKTRHTPKCGRTAQAHQLENHRNDR
jgi:hypothetical protein